MYRVRWWRARTHPYKGKRSARANLPTVVVAKDTFNNYQEEIDSVMTKRSNWSRLAVLPLILLSVFGCAEPKPFEVTLKNVGKSKLTMQMLKSSGQKHDPIEMTPGVEFVLIYTAGDKMKIESVDPKVQVQADIEMKKGSGTFDVALEGSKITVKAAKGIEYTSGPVPK